VAQQTPTLRRKELGRQLREMRTARSMTLEAVAAELLCSITKVSRMESGARPVGARDLRDLCRLYQVDDDVQERLGQLLKESHQTSWWQSYGLVSEYNTYIGLEQSASSIAEYHAMIIPGLLQTEEYAQALIEAMTFKLDADAVRARVDARIKRQSVLVQEDAPQLWGIIDELALIRVVGSREIMAAQLDFLVEFSRRPNIHIQVIRTSTEPYPGYAAPFTLLEFATADGQGPVVYTEGPFGDWLSERVEDVELSRQLYNQLRASGEGTADTRTIFRAARDRFRSPANAELPAPTPEEPS
jgi:transcriptional regulator with XRE-family HTH domain